MTSHLFLFQQDQAHDRDVDGVPNAGVMEQAGHLPKGWGVRLSPGSGTPAVPPARCARAFTCRNSIRAPMAHVLPQPSTGEPGPESRSGICFPSSHPGPPQGPGLPILPGLGQHPLPWDTRTSISEVTLP